VAGESVGGRHQLCMGCITSETFEIAPKEEDEIARSVRKRRRGGEGGGVADCGEAKVFGSCKKNNS
jgi:hypothetical protein